MTDSTAEPDSIAEPDSNADPGSDAQPGSDTDVYVSPTRVPATVALASAVVGAGAMGWSFPAGIAAALDGSSGGATPHIVVFLAAGVLVLAALVIAIVCLARGLARGIAALALVVALVPIVVIIVIRIAAGAT